MVFSFLGSRFNSYGYEYFYLDGIKLVYSRNHLMSLMV